jgi:uncharacterized protein (DUF2147 family)
MKKWLLAIISIFVFVTFAQAAEVNSSVVGYWQTMDPQTHKPDSIVRIWENHTGIYEGKIVKIFKENGHKITDVCKVCTGINKDKPIMGMHIIWGFHKAGPGFYTGGKVLDPTKGATYKCHMTLKNKGNVLDVHGYIGIPLFGRSATWYRVHPMG